MRFLHIVHLNEIFQNKLIRILSPPDPPLVALTDSQRPVNERALGSYRSVNGQLTAGCRELNAHMHLTVAYTLIGQLINNGWVIFQKIVICQLTVK